MLTNRACVHLFALHRLLFGDKFVVFLLYKLSFGVVDFSADGICVLFVGWTTKDAESARATANASQACNLLGFRSHVLYSTQTPPSATLPWVVKKDTVSSRRIRSSYDRGTDSRTWRIRRFDRNSISNGDSFFITHVFDFG